MLAFCVYSTLVVMTQNMGPYYFVERCINAHYSISYDTYN